MDYIIEKAKTEDLDAIHKLIYDRCLWFRKNGMKGWNINSYPNKYDKKYFTEQMKINNLFVAKFNNKICGFLLLKDKDIKCWGNDNSSAYYIHHLTTDINLKGIGKKLISYALEQCKINKKKYLRLDCYQESKFLNEYYKKIGFNKVGSGIVGNYKFNLWEMKIEYEDICKGDTLAK